MNNPQCKEWLARLYRSGQYTDLTIICDGHTFNVHKSVICMQSSFFEKACKKNAFMEGETGVVDLPGDDPAAVKAMLESFYLSSYSYDPKHPQWSLHTKVAALADKYDIKPLRSLAQELLGKAKHEVPKHEVEFATAIQWTYENTASDDQIRRTLVQMAVDHLNHLLKNESFSNIVAQVPELGRDILVENQERTDMTRKMALISKYTYKCIHCDSGWALLHVEDRTQNCPRCDTSQLAQWDWMFIYQWDCSICGYIIGSSNDNETVAGDEWICPRCGGQGFKCSNKLIY
ncbi:Siderophore iron transporter [Venturia nashicola]|uniref:Siderophore iron transporter n=1 Tax=Venturia nashicola TaxID=86259 RepID=A0A4Z1PE35_9PEZI|nr:Siderophore iron transporter [Venturia nashicola]